MKSINEAIRVLQESAELLAPKGTLSTKVVSVAYSRVKKLVDDYLKGIENLKSEDEKLCLGVVGQMKAGKSSFLNTLLFDGDAILPIAPTPMTAGITTIEHTDGCNRMEVCYYSIEDWKAIETEARDYEELRKDLLEEQPHLKGKDKLIDKAMEQRATSSQYASYLLIESLTHEAKQKIGQDPDVKSFSDISELQRGMAQYVGAEGKYTSVVSILKLYLTDDRLKGMRIVDTPGVNDPVVSREVCTHEYLHKCHGVFMLSGADHFMGADDISFMNQRLASVGVNSILLIGSKFDIIITNPQYRGKSLSEAVNKAKDSLRGTYSKGYKSLNREIASAICGLTFSSGMAKAVLIKLEKVNFDVNVAQFDDYEKHFWESLQKYYPNDFINAKAIERSLNLLADFDTIEVTIKNNFRAKNKEIRTAKRGKYLEQISTVIGETVSHQIKSLQNELGFIRSADLDSLKSQVETLKNGVISIVAPLQLIIDAEAAKLQNRWVEVEDDILSKRGVKVECEVIPTSSSCVTYTRLTTFWNRKTNGYIYVEQVNRPSLKEQQRTAMEKYKETIKSNWKKIFNTFRDKLMDDLIEKLGTIDAVASSDNMIVIQIVKEAFEVKLASFEVLRLDDTLSKYISSINSFIDESRHTSFYKSFGVKEESAADDDIKSQAKVNLNHLQSGIRTRNNDYMRSMKAIPAQHIDQIVKCVLLPMRNDITQQLNESIDKVLAEKTEQLSDKTRTIDELEDAILCLQKIKQTLND